MQSDIADLPNFPDGIADGFKLKKKHFPYIILYISWPIRAMLNITNFSKLIRFCESGELFRSDAGKKWVYRW